jgi:hypothetical protein
MDLTVIFAAIQLPFRVTDGLLAGIVLQNAETNWASKTG